MESTNNPNKKIDQDRKLAIFDEKKESEKINYQLSNHEKIKQSKDAHNKSMMYEEIKGLLEQKTFQDELDSRLSSIVARESLINIEQFSYEQQIQKLDQILTKNIERRNRIDIRCLLQFIRNIRFFQQLEDKEYLKEYQYLEKVCKVVRMQKVKRGQQFKLDQSKQNRVFVLIDGQMVKLQKKSKDQVRNEIQKMKNVEIREYMASPQKYDVVDRRRSLFQSMGRIPRDLKKSTTIIAGTDKLQNSVSPNKNSSVNSQVVSAFQSPDMNSRISQVQNSSSPLLKIKKVLNQRFSMNLKLNDIEQDNAQQLMLGEKQSFDSMVSFENEVTDRSNAMAQKQFKEYLKNYQELSDLFKDNLTDEKIDEYFLQKKVLHQNIITDEQILEKCNKQIIEQFYDKLIPDIEFGCINDKEGLFSSFRSKGEIRVLKYRYMKTINVNDVIGNLEVQTDQQDQMMYLASQDCIMITLTEMQNKIIIKQIEKERLKQMVQFLQMNPIYKTINFNILQKLTRLVCLKKYCKGQVVYKEKDSDFMNFNVYLVHSGEVQCVKDNKKFTVISQNYHFGEYEIINQIEQRIYTMIAISMEVTLIEVKNPDFKRLVNEQQPFLLNLFNKKISDENYWRQQYESQLFNLQDNNSNSSNVVGLKNRQKKKQKLKQMNLLGNSYQYQIQNLNQLTNQAKKEKFRQYESQCNVMQKKSIGKVDSQKQILNPDLVDQKVKQKLISQIDLITGKNNNSQSTYISSQDAKSTMSLKENKQNISKLFKAFKIKDLKKRQESEHNIFDPKLKQISKQISIQMQGKQRQSSDRIQSIGELSLRNNEDYLNEMVAQHNRQSIQDKSEVVDQSVSGISSNGIQIFQSQSRIGQAIDGLENKVLNKYGIRSIRRIQEEHVNEQWVDYLKEKDKIKQIHQQRASRILRNRKREKESGIAKTENREVDFNMFGSLKTNDY